MKFEVPNGVFFNFCFSLTSNRFFHFFSNQILKNHSTIDTNVEKYGIKKNILTNTIPIFKHLYDNISVFH